MEMKVRKELTRLADLSHEWSIVAYRVPSAVRSEDTWQYTFPEEDQRIWRAWRGEEGAMAILMVHETQPDGRVALVAWIPRTPPKPPKSRDATGRKKKAAGEAPADREGSVAGSQGLGAGV